MPNEPTQRLRRVRFWFRWVFTHDGATASLLYHDARHGPLPLTKGQAIETAPHHVSCEHRASHVKLDWETEDELVSIHAEAIAHAWSDLLAAWDRVEESTISACRKKTIRVDMIDIAHKLMVYCCELERTADECS